MKKIVFGLFIFLVSLSFYNAKALDEREVLNSIEGTSDINTMLVYGDTIKTPTFNIFTGTQVHFDLSEGGWYKNESGSWHKIINGYRFSSGTWQFRTQVRIDGEYGEMYKLGYQTNVTIDGEEWNFSYCSSCSGDNYSVGWIYSPSYNLDASGNLEFFEKEEYRVYTNYINTEIYSFSVASSIEGGTSPYTFSKVSGPSWINVSSEGSISGTPTVLGTNEDLVVRVTDNDDNYKEISIPVDKTILPPSLREEITNIEATSNISTIPVLGGNIVKPTFTITNVEGPIIVDYNSGWYKKIGDNWQLQESGDFTPGKWEYRTRVVLEGEPAESYKLTDDTLVTIDGEEWNHGLSGIANEYYEVSIKSKEYIVKGTINSIELNGTINAPQVGQDITEPSIGVISINNDPYLINNAEVEAKWQYKTGDGLFDWKDATGVFEKNKIYHVRLMITVNNDIYELDNIATFPVTFNNYELVQFQLNNKTVGEFIEFPVIESISIPNVSIKNDNNKITLSWDKQNAATKFIVYRSTNGKKYSKVSEVTSNSYIDKSLTYNKTYYYKVKSCDELKCTSYSNIVSKKIKPNKVKLSIKSAGTNNVKLSWDKVSTTGYEVSRSTDNKKWSKIKTITKNSTLEFNNKSLKSNKMYYYKVRAYKTVSGKKIYGSWSTVVSTKTAPVKPKVTLSIKNYDKVNIKIESSKGANLYVVYKSTDGKTYTKINEVSTYGTVVNGDNEIGKTYYYQVKACNKYNRCSSKVSLSIKQTTKTPSLNVESIKTKKVNVVVGSVDMADGYRVYRSTSKSGKYEMIKEIKTPEELTFTNSTRKGVTYYYKVRSYRIVNDKKIYSALSSYKKITIK